MRIWVFMGCMAIGAALSGCKGPSRTPWDNLRETQQRNTELSTRVQALEKENAQLKQQVETLSGLSKETRLEELSTLSEIKLHKRTNLYDKDNDGRPETLVVYLQTLDAQQDQVKAPGRCTVTLWNLGGTAQEYKLGEWSLGSEELQKLWGGNIFSQYYRIELPLGNVPAAEQELTIRAVFMDILTGKVLTAQLSFKPETELRT